MLFVSIALAEPLIPAPERPKAPVAVKDECFEAVGLDAGKPFPQVLVRADGKASCSGVVLPVSQYLDLDQTESWANTVYTHYRSADAFWRHRLGEIEVERDQWMETAQDRQSYTVQLQDKLNRQSAWYRQPGWNMVFGAGIVLAGGGLMIGGALAL